jgi:hypothetical protein
MDRSNKSLAEMKKEMALLKDEAIKWLALAAKNVESDSPEKANAAKQEH